MRVDITAYECLIIAPSDADATLCAEYTALATAGTSAIVTSTEKKGGELRLRRSAISAHAAHSALYFCSPLQFSRSAVRSSHLSRISSCEIQDADADGESAPVRFLVLRLNVMISQASLEWPVENYIYLRLILPRWILRPDLFGLTIPISIHFMSAFGFLLAHFSSRVGRQIWQSSRVPLPLSARLLRATCISDSPQRLLYEYIQYNRLYEYSPLVCPVFLCAGGQYIAGFSAPPTQPMGVGVSMGVGVGAGAQPGVPGGYPGRWRAVALWRRRLPQPQPQVAEEWRLPHPIDSMEAPETLFEALFSLRFLCPNDLFELDAYVHLCF